MSRGQSETVGALLLVGIVVLALTVLAAFLFAPLTTDPGPTVDVDGAVTDDAVTLRHAGGDGIPGDELTVLLRYGGTETRYDFASDGQYGDDAVFDAGDRWRLDGPVPYGPGDEVELRLLHEPSGTVLFSGQKIAATATATTTPAPPAAVEATGERSTTLDGRPRGP